MYNNLLPKFIHLLKRFTKIITVNANIHFGFKYIVVIYRTGQRCFKYIVAIYRIGRRCFKLSLLFNDVVSNISLLLNFIV